MYRQENKGFAKVARFLRPGKWLTASQFCICKSREERWLWKVQGVKMNTTCILRSRSSWLAWVSGPFWLLSSIRNRESQQRTSIVGVCHGCNHEGTQRNE